MLACFESDHLFCLLVTLERRFLMQHHVDETERRTFITTVGKLSKMSQYYNEHVAEVRCFLNYCCRCALP